MIWILYIVAFWVFAPVFLVGIGLPFKKYKGVRIFDKVNATMQYDLPDWLYWLQNQKDGLTGDSRGWYWNEYFPSWVPGWFKMLWWSGVRNPWNNLKRFVIGIDVREFTFHKLRGDDYVRDDLFNEGFQILYARPKDGWFYRPMLYWVRRWGYSKRGICIQIGWKIRLEHNTATYEDWIDNFKGFTLEPNPYKDLT